MFVQIIEATFVLVMTYLILTMGSGKNFAEAIGAITGVYVNIVRALQGTEENRPGGGGFANV